MAKNRFSPFVRGGPSAIYQPTAIAWPQDIPPGATYPQFEIGQVAIVPPNNQVWMFVNTVKGSGAAIWVQLTGGSSPATFSISGDDSTLVFPNSSGNIFLVGNVVANSTHGKALYLESPSSNTENFDIQLSAAIASTNITKVGISAFNSNQFSVDSNGFVSLLGTGPTFNTINIQEFTTTGTYTPTTGMQYCIIECLGGGGGGGGSVATMSSQYSVGAGGACGEYARGVFSASSVGSSKSVTIGSGGAGNSGTTGTTGGTTSVGALITAIGGSGGGSSTAGTSSIAIQSTGGTGGSGGQFRSPGNTGNYGFLNSAFGFSGEGGSSPYGAGGYNQANVATGNGGPGAGYGSGGGGGYNQPSQSATTGGAGSAGMVIITEFIA